jgi:hypothetical protein
MVLKTRSWSLFTVTRRSSPNEVMVNERVLSTGGEESKIGRMILPLELANEDPQD